MHLTIVNNDTHVTSIRTRQRTLLHTRHNTFHNSRQEACIDRTTDNTVDKHQFTTPFQWYLFRTSHGNLKFLSIELIRIGHRHTFFIRFYNQVNFTKLTGTTGLFLMTIVSASGFCNRFTIRNLRFFVLHRKFFVVFQTPFQCTKMEFSLSVYQSLLQLL